MSRTVVVTGGSRGLGRHISIAFAEAGDKVFVGYRARAAEAEKTVALVREKGGDAVGLKIDVTDAASVERAIGEVLGERGAIDVVVNNAAVAHDEPFSMMSEEAWTEVLRTNLDGPFRVARAVARPMMKARRGTILNVGSIAGLRASPGQTSYAASKAGLAGLTATLAVELAPYGIRVNGVLPGLLSTGMAERLDHRVRDRHKERIPLKRLGTGAEVAAVLVFLASDAAAYIVGQSIVVDGGFSL